MAGTDLPQMHGRTHCPGGSDPIPCLSSGPYAVIVYTAGGTIASNTPTPLASLSDFADSYISDTDLLSVDLAAAKIIFLKDGDNIRAPGLYTAHLAIAWADPITGPMYASVNWQVNTFEAVEDQVMGTTGQGSNTHIVTGEDSLCSSSVLIQTNNVGHNNWVTGALSQVGGSGKALNQITLKVWREAIYPGAKGAFKPK